MFKQLCKTRIFNKNHPIFKNIEYLTVFDNEAKELMKNYAKTLYEEDGKKSFIKRMKYASDNEGLKIYKNKWLYLAKNQLKLSPIPLYCCFDENMFPIGAFVGAEFSVFIWGLLYTVTLNEHFHYSYFIQKLNSDAKIKEVLKNMEIDHTNFFS